MRSWPTTALTLTNSLSTGFFHRHTTASAGRGTGWTLRGLRSRTGMSKTMTGHLHFTIAIS